MTILHTLELVVGGYVVCSPLVYIFARLVMPDQD